MDFSSVGYGPASTLLEMSPHYDDILNNKRTRQKQTCGIHRNVVTEAHTGRTESLKNVESTTCEVARPKHCRSTACLMPCLKRPCAQMSYSLNSLKVYISRSTTGVIKVETRILGNDSVGEGDRQE